MKHAVNVTIQNHSILLELDDVYSPNTVNDFVEKLPFTVDLNVWGDEIYTTESPISQPEENAKSPVELNNVAYWPQGKAICLFFGPIPIGNPGEITPAYPLSTYLEKLYRPIRQFCMMLMALVQHLV